MKPSLVDYYRHEVFPHLRAELVYANVRFTSRTARDWRGPCPLHGGNNPTAFSVDPQTLTWTCYTTCQRSGDALAFLNGGDSPRGPRFKDIVHQAAAMAQTDLPAPRLEPPKKLASPLAQLHQQYQRFQDYLPRSWGERYLQTRGISLELAQRCGLGYAPPGQWPHKSRDWRWGRLVFPHTDPEGNLVNLYGRALGPNDKVPQAIRHDHLPGSKGYFRAETLTKGDGPLYVCEGPFDALSLLAAGHIRVLATFGARSWRWDWVRNIDHLVFALDQDPAGQTAQQTLARGALLRGKQASAISSEALGKSKDINEWWCNKPD
jgi:DNA primase